MLVGQNVFRPKVVKPLYVSLQPKQNKNVRKERLVPSKGQMLQNFLRPLLWNVQNKLDRFPRQAIQA
jgi:hypothetical protein